MAFFTCQTVLGLTMSILTNVGGGHKDCVIFMDICIEEGTRDVDTHSTMLCLENSTDWTSITRVEHPDSLLL